MAKLSRTTLYEAYMFLSSRIQYHGDFEDLMYAWELDQFAEVSAGAVHVRLRKVLRYLKDNPDGEHNGHFLIDLFVEEALRRRGSWTGEAPQGEVLLRSIERDGFTIDQDGAVRRMLPAALDLPAADDEVHMLLGRHELITPKGHLDQAIRAHSDGDWAAANSQFRTFSRISVRRNRAPRGSEKRAGDKDRRDTPAASRQPSHSISEPRTQRVERRWQELCERRF